MGVSKEYRNEVVQHCIQQLKSLGLSEKTIGFFMRAYHVNVPIYFFIAMIYGSYAVNIGLLIFLFGALISFIVFDGCILSRIESTLDDEDITVVDPMLEILGLEVNNKNRVQVSYVIAGLYLGMAILIFWFRFRGDLNASFGSLSPLTPGDFVPQLRSSGIGGTATIETE
jgi:hypothetical protein